MTDSRAVSTTINYVLTLGIATLLITGLLIAGADFMSSQRDQTTRAELDVVSQQVTADLTAADRMAVAMGDDGMISLERSFPARAGGVSYLVEIESTGATNGYSVVARTDTGVVATVNFTAKTTIETPQSFAGGDVRIEWDSATDQIEVTND